VMTNGHHDTNRALIERDRVRESPLFFHPHIPGEGEDGWPGDNDDAGKKDTSAK